MCEWTVDTGHNPAKCEMMHAPMMANTSQPSPIDDSTKHPAQRGQDGTKSRPPESRERSPCSRAYTAQDQVWFRLQEQCL